MGNENTLREALKDCEKELNKIGYSINDLPDLFNILGSQFRILFRRLYRAFESIGIFD